MIDIRLDGDNGVLVWSDEVGVRIFNIDPLAEIGRLDTGSTLSGKVQCEILSSKFKVLFLTLSTLTAFEFFKRVILEGQILFL